MSWLRKDQYDAIRAVAAELGWDQMPVRQVGLLMFCAFHYYVMRLNGLATDESLAQSGRPPAAAGKTKSG